MASDRLRPLDELNGMEFEWSPNTREADVSPFQELIATRTEAGNQLRGKVTFTFEHSHANSGLIVQQEHMAKRRSAAHRTRPTSFPRPPIASTPPYQEKREQQNVRHDLSSVEILGNRLQSQTITLRRLVLCIFVLAIGLSFGLGAWAGKAYF